MKKKNKPLQLKKSFILEKNNPLTNIQINISITQYMNLYQKSHIRNKALLYIVYHKLHNYG